MDRTPPEHGLLQTLVRAFLILFAAVLLWRFFAGIATVLLLLLVGVLLAVALSAPVEALHRRKVPRSVAAGAIFVGVLLVVGVFAYLFFPEIQRQSFQFSNLLPFALGEFVRQVRDLASLFGINLSNDSGSPAATLVNVVQQLAGGLFGLLGTVVFLVVGIIAAIFLALYLAASPEPIVQWTERLFPPERRPRVHAILSEIRTSLLSWFKGKLLAMLIIGVLATAALYIIGIPGALVLGILSGLLEFVPYIGPILSAVLPALIAFAGKPIDALYVVLAYVFIQQVESNLVQPLIMKRAADVHPAVVIVFVTLLGAVFGLLGALLAVPLALVAGILVKELWFRRLEEDAGGASDGAKESGDERRGRPQEEDCASPSEHR